MSEAAEAKRVIELPSESFSRREDRELPAIVPPANATPMSMLAVAVQKGMDVATIKDLMDLQDRWEKAEARKAFVVALNAFKADPPELHKNKTVSYELKTGGRTEYKHATLDQVSVSIGKALADHGLSHRWNVEQLDGGMIRVTCVLQHARGHSESVSMAAGRDDSGSKNNIQALGSTVTYLQRYTLLAATGMAVKDQDNDGAGDEKNGMPDADFQAFKKNIEAALTKEDAKKEWAKGVKACEKLGDIESAEDLKKVLIAHGTFIDQAAKAK